jgi:hypothetical protein
MHLQVLVWSRRAFLRAVIASMFVVMSAMPVIAQVTALSSIRGTVTDATGAALPGVTVTLTSPALQVAEMTAVTQPDGSYRFGELPAGIYRLKFELTGFNTLVREELRLTVGFEARVDAPLTIGTVQESVTVSGESPVVDLAKTTTAANLSKDQIAMLPVGRGFQQLYAMTPGVNATGAPDVGDSQMNNRQSLMSFGVQTASKIEIEGINIATDAGEGGTGVYMSSFSVEEAQIRTSGNTAEVSTPGISMTTVLKSGSNSFHGTFTGAGQRPKLQSSNLDDRLRAQGLTNTTPLRYYWEASGDLGGRITRDKLWFYVGTSRQERSTGLLGFVAGPGADGKYLTGDEPLADYVNGLTQYTTKLSYQLSPSNKLIGVYQRGTKLQPQQGAGRFRPLEATIDYKNPGWIYKGELQSSLTSRMFLNVVAGYGGLFADYSAPRSPNANAVKGNPSKTDLTSGLTTGAYWNSENSTEGKAQVDSSLNYLPDRFLGGRHELKFGNTIYLQHYSLGGVNAPQGNYQLVTDAGQPTQIIIDNLPLKPANRGDIYAAYAQDTWRVSHRLTANLGVRWERQHAYLPTQAYDGSPDFPTVYPSGTFPYQDLTTWVRTVPRLGLAWDIDGKSVVKTSFGLYNVNIGSSFGFAYNRDALSRTTFRWRDSDGNGDYTPGETDLTLNGGNDFLSVSGGGTAVPAPDLRQPLTTEATLGFERQVAANVGFRTMYVFRKVSDRYADVELNRPRSAYDIPLTRRDPGPDGVLNNSDDGGKVTIYDYNAAYRGAAFSSVQRQNATPGREDHFNSFEVSLNKRMTHRWSATGSFWGTKNYRWLTLHDVNPNNDPFPLDQTWFWAGNVTATYLLPWEVQMGAYLQSKVGILGQRTYQFRATDPDGGPPLTSLSTVTLRLEPYGAMRAAPENVLNLRVSKVLVLGKGRASVNFEVFNVLNTNADTGLTFASGPTYGYSTGVLPPRVARIGGTYGF